MRQSKQPFHRRGPGRGPSWQRSLRKYFVEGQRRCYSKLALIADHTEPWMEWERNLYNRHPNLVAILITVCCYLFVWLVFAIRFGWFAKYRDVLQSAEAAFAPYDLSSSIMKESKSINNVSLPSFNFKYSSILIASTVGSLIAGATCKSSGSVVFPSFVFIYNLPYDLACDFVLLTQAIGLSATTLQLWLSGAEFDKHVVALASLGGVVGALTSIEAVSHLSPDIPKFLFLSFSFPFTIALFLIDRRRRRTSYRWIQNISIGKLLAIFCAGFAGGLQTGLSGTGVDLHTYSIACLAFHLSDRVACASSTVAMCITTLVLALYRAVSGQVNANLTYGLTVCVAPVIVVVECTGVLITAHFHPRVLVCLLYALELVALLMSLVLVRPEYATSLQCSAVGLLLCGFHYLAYWYGARVGYVNTTGRRGPHRSPRKKWRNTVRKLVRQPRA